jgi:TAT (twin-arginine translocation) pathway signal sequence
MVLNINRRWFLGALTAVGAATALPGSVRAASAAQIDEAWDQMLMAPWFFEVAEYGTIVEVGVPEPKINADLYDTISLDFLTTPDRLIREISSYAGIREHFGQLVENEIEDLRDRVNYPETGLSRKEIRRLKGHLQRLEAWDAEYDAWEPWIRSEGKKDFARFRGMLENFLARNVDWNQMEIWPQGWSGQGKALSFFQEMDPEIADALGVAIIEGQHPGSTYFAAELRDSIENANENAQRLGLPFRFCEEGIRSEASATV